MEPRSIGRTIVAMGGGRRSLDDVLDMSAGIKFHRKPGDRVEVGDDVATVFAADDNAVERGIEGLQNAVVIGADSPSLLPLVSHRVTMAGVSTFNEARPDPSL